MGEPSYGRWHKRAFCPCGRNLEEPFTGELWFTRQHFPVCPSCGGSAYAYVLKTVRSVCRGWFKPTTFEEQSAPQQSDDPADELEKFGAGYPGIRRR